MLELTESVLLRRDERIHSDLMELKVIGVKLAIDDFGTATHRSVTCGNCR
jgi:EAL domain-containing protein (putative c-di-GMP-specific phosphodiesterase class I)